MANVIINYSTAVQPGERVLLRGSSPAAEPLIQALYQAALRAGGQAFTYIHMADEDSLAIEASDNLELLAAVNPMLKLMYETCQVIVRVEASENPRALSDYSPERQRARLESLAGVMSIQMEREGNGTLRRCTTP
jgi:aminopeptidase